MVNKVLNLAGGASVGLGRNMANESVNGKYRLGHSDPRPLPTDGFKTELTNNGQGADVYKHIYGVAGAVLIGDNYVIAQGVSGRGGLTGFQNLQRQLQDDMDSAARGRKESETEMRDNYAGIAVGGAMLKGIKNGTRPEALRKELFDILCAH